MSNLHTIAFALSVWTFLLLPRASTGQEILPPLDLTQPSGEADFVPGEIIVKLKEAPASPDAAGEIQEFEAVALSDNIRPLGNGAFLVKLDVDLFTSQSMETLAGRTAKVATELEKRDDIASARAGQPGVVVFRPADAAEFEAAVAAGEFENIALEGEPEELSNGNYAMNVNADLISPNGPSLRQRTIEALEELRKRPDVEYAQLNYIAEPYLTHLPNDVNFPRQWNLFDNGSGSLASAGGINLLKEWDNGIGDASVVVAVIDTGIVTDHPDIQPANMVSGFDMIRSDRRAADSQPGRDSDPTDKGDGVAAFFCSGKPLAAIPDSWHGTHVAGIVGIGGTNNAVGIAGVNWNVKVQPIRALGKCGGDAADIKDAILYAAGLPVPITPNEIVTNPTPARIINLSLGFKAPCSELPDIQAAIDAAAARGVTIIVAAGNDAIDASEATPGGCKNVITVAASDARGHLVERYSNFGPRIDIMAPGGDTERDDNHDNMKDGVLSMVKGGYRPMNGTSMAAPHVAGVAALMLSRNPALTPIQILARLKANAIPRTNQDCPKPCGAGLLNAFFPAAPEPADAAPAAAAGSPTNPEP